MKIAITTTGDNLDAQLDRRFGRASRFLLYDLDTKTFEIIDNAMNMNAPQGAGIQAAQTVVNADAGCVITGHCGPNAFHVLTQAGVKIFNTDAATISDALDLYNQGKLTQAGSADKGGHWS